MDTQESVRADQPTLEREITGPDFRIGIDGGGSGTRARLIAGRGDPLQLPTLGIGQGGPSALNQGVAQAWRHIDEALDAAFAAAGLVRPPPAALDLAIGISGAEIPDWRRALRAAAPPFRRLLLANDGLTALLGAHAGAPGALITCGTGIIGIALAPNGAQRCASGWGYPLGDEGSGAWIGRHALRHAMRVLDGRAEPSPLASDTCAACGDSRDALQAWTCGANQAAVAALAPLVFANAAHDTEAARVLRRAAEELEALAHAIDADGELPLCLCGSVGEALQPYLDPRLRQQLRPPRGDALDGALRLFERQDLAFAAD